MEKISLKINKWRKNYSDKTVWTDMYRGTIYKKYVFQSSNFLWPKLSIFPKKGNFLPLNGRKDCQYFAQSCPRGWQRLTPKRSVGATKLFDAVLKVWDNKWDCGGYMPLLHILRRLCAEEIITNHQISSKTPTDTKNHHQYPPTKQYVPRKWFLVTICISNGVYKGEKC